MGGRLYEADHARFQLWLVMLHPALGRVSRRRIRSSGAATGCGLAGRRRAATAAVTAAAVVMRAIFII